HVATAQELAAQPLTLHVGPLYGAPATVRDHRVQPNAMPWLQLHTGIRGVFPPGAMPTGEPLPSPPATIGGGPAGGQAAARHEVEGDRPLGRGRKSTRLNSSHVATSYALFCLKKKTRSVAPART